MKRRMVVSLLLVLFAASNAAAQKSLLVVAFDGAGLNNVQELLKDGKMPNLQAFINEGGGKLLPLETVYATQTEPTWAMFFTGLTPVQTGVFGNTSLRWGHPHSVETKELLKYSNKHKVYKWPFWVKPIPGSWTFPHMLKNRLGVKTAFITAKGRFFGNNPLRNPLVHMIKDMDYSSTCQPKYSTQQTYLNEMIEQASSFLKEYHSQPVFMFFLANPDWFGHKYGENSSAYLEAIIAADKAFGELRSMWNGKGKILVLDDHGFDDNGSMHYNANDVWAVTDLPVRREYCLQIDGNQVGIANHMDLANTILEWYGIDWKQNWPRSRGKAILKTSVWTIPTYSR